MLAHHFHHQPLMIIALSTIYELQLMSFHLQGCMAPSAGLQTERSYTYHNAMRLRARAWDQLPPTAVGRLAKPFELSSCFRLICKHWVDAHDAATEVLVLRCVLVSDEPRARAAPQARICSLPLRLWADM